jgi:Glycine zipper 2TM domain
MSRWLLSTTLAAAVLVGGAASAEPGCPSNTSNRTVGTIIGAGLGALFGNAVASHGGKPGGTIIGGVAGGVAGNMIAGSGSHCVSNRYGYYDAQGKWVPNTSNAEGYYDADGHWVRYADQHAAQASNQQDGYYDASGRWVPAPPPRHGDQGQGWNASADSREREAWLERRIRHEMDEGRMDRADGERTLKDLADVRRLDGEYRAYDGNLDADQQAYIDGRLENLRHRLRAEQASAALNR